MPQTPRFPLTRYFVLTSLVTGLVVGAALATITGREVRQDLLRKSEQEAEQLIRNLNRQVHLRFIHPTIARDGLVDLDRKEHLAALDETVRLAVAEHGIQAVYFFDLEGRITYATRPEHRGFVIEDNQNYLSARNGTSSSRVVARGNPLDVSGQPESVELLETYVPIHALDERGAPGGAHVGVIEVYQDATDLLAESRQASYRVAGMSTVGVLTLTLALWLWIRKAERAIEERDQALIEANARLAALSQDLERQVEDRTRRLVRAETLASVGTLGAGVAHEVNNPIAAIASCAEGLLRRTRAPEMAELPAAATFREYLEIIRDEAFRVKEVTRNLLDFSRTGGTERMEPVDLGALLGAAGRLIGHRLEREEKHLALDLPPEPVVVLGDGTALRQLVLNLSVNAIDASPAGGTIRWSLRATPEGAELVCADEGPGFTPEELERACEPFYTNKPTGRGTGLGLAIAYGVARRHGGRLELGNGAEGRGARVVVRLSGREGRG